MIVTDSQVRSTMDYTYACRFDGSCFTVDVGGFEEARAFARHLGIEGASMLLEGHGDLYRCSWNDVVVLDAH
jgi:hypothetical protein